MIDKTTRRANERFKQKHAPRRHGPLTAHDGKRLTKILDSIRRKNVTQS